MSAVITIPSAPSDSLHSPKPILTFDPAVGAPSGLRLECRLQPALHDSVLGAHQHSRRWILETGLVGHNEMALERCLSARFAWLGARSYPTATTQQLCLVTDWLSFLFFYDDLCDTAAINEDVYRGDLEELEDRFITVAHGAAATADDDPLAHALADIRARLAQWAHPSWLHRFAEHFEEYIEGVRWERLIRVQGQVPSLPTYARLRLLSSAVFPCFDLAGMFIDPDDGSFTDDVFIRQLEVMANDHISWVNDIYGIDKELREQTTANLVVVLAHDHGLAWNDALELAIHKCNDELDAFFGLSHLVTRRCDARAHAYVDALGSWMRGNLDWYGETTRYQRASS